MKPEQQVKQSPGVCAVCGHCQDDHDMASTTACAERLQRIEGIIRDKLCDCGRYKVE